MKVLAIDPGYDRVGVAVLEKDHKTNQEILLYSSCIETNIKDDLSSRILQIGTEVETLIGNHQPDAVAIENLFFNKNVKTAIGVAQAKGAIIYLAKKYNCLVFEFGPQEIKIAITGYGKSDKKAVFSMIKRLVKGVPENALDDEYDAIAVGITCLAHNVTNR